MRFSSCKVLRIAIFAMLFTSNARAEEVDTAKWEPEIKKFAANDREQMPSAGGILLVGSSSIRLWDLKASFPEFELINRGFGGSTIPDSTALIDRIVIPYRPGLIVFYAGDNDLASGRSPGEVAKDFEAFVEKARHALPEARIIYLSIKISRSRWALRDKVREANRLIEQYIAKQRNMEFVDVAQLLLNDAGEPDPTFFQADQLHLSPEGYRRWSDELRPHLRAFSMGGKPGTEK